MDGLQLIECQEFSIFDIISHLAASLSYIYEINNDFLQIRNLRIEVVSNYRHHQLFPIFMPIEFISL